MSLTRDEGINVIAKHYGCAEGIALIIHASLRMRIGDAVREEDFEDEGTLRALLDKLGTTGEL